MDPNTKGDIGIDRLVEQTPLVRPGSPAIQPTKRINREIDVVHFSTSTAYVRIQFLLTLFSAKVVGKRCPRLLLISRKNLEEIPTIVSHPNDKSTIYDGLFSKPQKQLSFQDIPQNVATEYEKFKLSKGTMVILELLRYLNLLVDATPPVAGPRRFGNVAFRTWHDSVSQRASSIIASMLRLSDLGSESKWEDDNRINDISNVLSSYLLGGFGSKDRLDFGTGHELNFMAFIGCLLFLRLLDPKTLSGEEILIIFETYFDLMRKIVTEYTLEPAGSHGVWGLDDHFALPYILGAAQLSESSDPPPASVLNRDIIKSMRYSNLYFSAIAFINEVKKGPFFEHSPMLFDISGVPRWSKIAQGMRKMYTAEILKKFPVVQHFLFDGSFFTWDAASDTDLHV